MSIVFHGLVTPVGKFVFCDPPTDPNTVTPAAAVQPNPADADAALKAFFGKPIEDQVAFIKAMNPKLHDTIFGKGVTKAERELARKNPLTEEQVAAATELFAKIKPEQINALLEAQATARQAALDKAKAEQDFTKFSEQLETKHAQEMESLRTSMQAKIDAAVTGSTTSAELISKLRKELAELKITDQILRIAVQQNLNDPTDAVGLLRNSLSMDDDLQVVGIDGQKANIEAMVKSLIATKPHLVRSTQIPGHGSMPPANTGGAGGGGTPPSGAKPSFKRSELRDRAFYVANEAAIMLAMKEGRIVDDVGN